MVCRQVRIPTRDKSPTATKTTLCTESSHLLLIVHAYSRLLVFSRLQGKEGQVTAQDPRKVARQRETTNWYQLSHVKILSRKIFSLVLTSKYYLFHDTSHHGMGTHICFILRKSSERVQYSHNGNAR